MNGIPSFLCCCVRATGHFLGCHGYLTVWKRGRVCPVFKKGGRNFSEVFDKVIHDSIYGHVKCQIVDNQHEFIKSTDINLSSLK